MILSNIRVTYSGFIAFGASVFSSVTGLIFVIIVTRQLEPEDFGLWTLIGSLVAYIAILHPIIGYWTTREIARGEKVGRTSIFSSGFLSGVGFLIYSGIAIYVSYSLGADLLVLMLASILVPISFLNNTLGSICLGFKPQAVSYGTVAFELGKLPVGFLLVYVMQLEIIGVLITLILATFMRTIVLMVLGKTQIIDIGPMSGKSNVVYWLRNEGIEPDESLVEGIFNLAKMSDRILTHNEIMSVVENKNSE